MKYTIRVGILAALAAFTVLSLSGCVQHHYEWQKAGVTQQEFALDKYNCENDMRQSVNSFGYDGSIVGAIVANSNAQAFGEECMNAHGYTKVQINQRPMKIYSPVV